MNIPRDLKKAREKGIHEDTAGIEYIKGIVQRRGRGVPASKLLDEIENVLGDLDEARKKNAEEE